MLITLSALKAQVTQGAVRNGNITIYGSSYTDVYGLDFNNDGTLEFKITDYGDVANAYLSYDWSEGGNNIVASDAGWDYIATLAEGTTINASSNFAGYGDGFFAEASSLTGTFYVGLRFRLADGVHFGWAKVNASQGSLSWNECYYNASPNAPINAGQTTGGVGIAHAENASLQAYGIGNHQIEVVADNAEVKVYDISGRLVGQTYVQGETTIAMPQAGLYVVRSATGSSKVVAY